jgi:hypothetical protein
MPLVSIVVAMIKYMLLVKEANLLNRASQTNNQTLIELPLEMVSQDKDKIVETLDKL